MPGMMDIRVDQMEEVLKDAGTDWDRRTHRTLVLAGAGDMTLARIWIRRRPRSADAVLFPVWVDLVRGDGGTIRADPRAAMDTCYRAAELQPASPLPWIALVAMLRLLAHPQQEVFAVWREVTSRDPWNREAYLQMLGYLSPEECGSHAQVLDFVDAVRSGMPPQSPAVGLELVSMIQRYRRTVTSGGVAALTSSRLWSQPPVEAVLDRALHEWPQPGFLTHAAALADLNLLAYALVRASRMGDAAPVFRAIGPVVTAWPWELDGDPLQQFTHWQERILD